MRTNQNNDKASRNQQKIFWQNSKDTEGAKFKIEINRCPQFDLFRPLFEFSQDKSLFYAAILNNKHPCIMHQSYWNPWISSLGLPKVLQQFTVHLILDILSSLRPDYYSIRPHNDSPRKCLRILLSWSFEIHACFPKLVLFKSSANFLQIFP